MSASRISLLVFDLSTNCLGRAYLIGRVVERSHDVEVLGPVFGDGIWPPHAKDFRYKSVKGSFFPFFLASAKSLLRRISGDIIYAFKPRFTSYGIGLLKTLLDKRMPLILDMDEWEVGDYLDKGLLAIFCSFVFWDPRGLPYTLMMEPLIKLANEITVASRFAQKRFGGTYIPHGVDTEYFDPSRYDRERLREAWGIRDEKIILFLGTPRPHKGLEDILGALDQLEAEVSVKLMMTGDIESSYVRLLLSLGKGKIRFLGLQPKSMEPLFLSMADLVVLPQRITRFSVSQTPAKAFSAMAMAKPIVATTVSDLPEILDNCGVLVKPNDKKELTKAISYVISDDDLAKKLGEKAREKCIKNYSWNAMEKLLAHVIEAALR